MDPRNVFAKLGDSRKFIFACLVLVLVAALVAFGKAAYADFVSTAKWIGGAFILATGIEGIGGSSSSSTPSPAQAEIPIVYGDPKGASAKIGS